MLKRTFPLVEVFGPVVEGEGALAGQVTSFLRFGYCDSRCSWCDSKHAVDPGLLKETATWLPINTIYQQLKPTLTFSNQWVTLSGGNPAIWDLGDLVEMIQDRHNRVKVETQGTIFRPWLNYCDHVVVSPKPPSAQPGLLDEKRLERFMPLLKAPHSLKFVVFDEADLQFAFAMTKRYARFTVYLSCGTLETDTRDDLGERYAWLCENALRPGLFNTLPVTLHVLPQLHVVAFKHKLGV